jgi:hypothetical protein
MQNGRLSELAKALLSRQDRRLLLQTHHLLEELLETEEVLRDKRVMKSIRESQGDVKGGRLYPIERLKRQLPQGRQTIAFFQLEAFLRRACILSRNR